MLEYLLLPSLIPFYSLVVLFVAVCQPHLAEPQDDVLCAVLKACPIWYLALHVAVRRPERTPRPTLDENGFPLPGPPFNADAYHGRYYLSYRNAFALGLLVSSIGDVLLNFDGYFEIGIAFFAVAHILYTLALKRLYLAPLLSWLLFPVNAVIGAFLLNCGLDDFYKIVILGYSLIINVMIFFAFAGYESYPNSFTALGALGASLFVVSDVVIAYQEFCAEVPYRFIIVMVIYYSGQLCLSSSVP